MPATANINQFEYCYLVEDTEPTATEMKIYVPKLMGLIPMNNTPQDESVMIDCVKNTNKGDVDGNATTQGYIVAKVQDTYSHEHKHHNCPGNCVNESHDNDCGKSTSILAPCPHFHHDHHFPHKDDYGMIPAGAQLICCIMDHNIKDIIVTRMWCKFSESTKITRRD